MKSFHLCKEDFEDVKERLGMGQVAERYGCRTSRSGFCTCPFHEDRHPSMKIYSKGFYCFTCGAGGDLIKFVALLNNVGNSSACLELVEEFGLPDPRREMGYREKRERESRARHRRKISGFKEEARAVLLEYYGLLAESSWDPSSPHFEEALQGMALAEYRLGCLEECPEEYYNDSKAVRKVGEIRDRIAGWHGCPEKIGAAPG